MESWQWSDRFCRQMSWLILLEASPDSVVLLWVFSVLFGFLFLSGGEDSLVCDDKESSPEILYSISLKGTFVTLITLQSSMYCVHRLEYR